jgi:choline-sulfatase
MNFFEGSARVPLMIAAPEMPAGRIETPVSSIDLAPTLAALAGISMDEVAPWTEGVNLIPVANGAPRPPVAMEYAAEGTITPMVALREGAWKYIRCPADPDLLFDVANDPHEATNLATDPRAAEILTHFRILADQNAGTSPPTTPRSAKARPAAGWSMRRCATAPISPGTTSPCARRPNATCATTWT